jgi:hypothetical protein
MKFTKAAKETDLTDIGLINNEETLPDPKNTEGNLLNLPSSGSPSNRGLNRID